MTTHGPARTILAATLALAFGRAVAAEPAGRGGGLLPTRDEILGRYDLDSNGRIDEGEAEAARIRMRRDRQESLRSSGIDPLTGRPRDSKPAEDRGREAARAPQAAPEAPAPADPKPATAPAPERPQPTGAPLKPQSMTGGVRAGAPAVRPGYGAQGVKKDLNAGRPRTSPAAPPRPRGSGVMPSRGPALFPQGGTRPTAEDIGR